MQLKLCNINYSLGSAPGAIEVNAVVWAANDRSVTFAAKLKAPAGREVKELEDQSMDTLFALFNLLPAPQLFTPLSELLETSK